MWPIRVRRSRVDPSGPGVLGRVPQQVRLGVLPLPRPVGVCGDHRVEVLPDPGGRGRIGQGGVFADVGTELIG